jgi:hypothetical protein
MPDAELFLRTETALLGEIDRLRAENKRLRKMIHSAWLPSIVGMGVGAALFAAGMAFAKLLG